MWGSCGRPPGDICLILNKRSARVRQAGDLCCPGGRVNPRFDFYAARLLGCLGRWGAGRAGERGVGVGRLSPLAGALLCHRAEGGL